MKESLVLQVHDANMMNTQHKRTPSIANRSMNHGALAALAGALVACLLCGALASTAAPAAWADAPESDGTAVSSSAWQAKPESDEDKADLAAAIQQEAYAQQSESGTTGYVGPYYAIQKRFVTDVESNFEKAAEEQYLVSSVSTALAAFAVVAAIFAALALVKSSRVRARANVLRNRRR